MQTLNQHITLLRNYSSVHWQINSFGVGDAWELVESFTKTNGVIGEDGTVDKFRNYPVMWVEVNGSSLSGSVLTDSYNIYFADLVNKDERDELEVLSDMKQLCLDVAAYLKQSSDIETNMDVILEFTMEDFTEKFNDEVAGWTLSVQIKQPYQYNLCAVPKSDSPTGFSNCKAVTVTDGATVTEVPSGGAYTCVNDSFTYDLYFDGVDTGQNVTVDGTNITINLS